MELEIERDNLRVKINEKLIESFRWDSRDDINRLIDRLVWCEKETVRRKYSDAVKNIV